MTTPEQQAKEIVAMFSDVELPRWCDMSTIEHDAAIQCAILHVEKVIEVLSEIRFKDKFIMKDINRYQQLSTILKNKL